MLAAIRAESAVERSRLLIEAEELLAREAWCLDMRQWQPWLDLYLEDAVFWAPAWRNDDEMTDDVKREISLFYFDSRAGLADRVWRIQTGRAAALTPMPRTTHLVSNALLAEGESDNALTVYSAFTCNIFSLRDRSQHSYFGRYEHDLVRRDGAWRIARKKIIVMNDYIPAVVEFFCI
ncbi:MAG: 3-phenylpropionate/cinnamic acid dioxygenase small subunit [Gammaproteobacteria bacterium]|jgi:3-phenylpropionate/cinnamic acid dioxygenase small subunit